MTGLMTPKRQKIHGLKLTDSIGHFAKNTIQMVPNSISPESVKYIACVDQKTKEIEQMKTPI